MAQRIDVTDIENLKPGDGVQVDKDTKYEFGADLEADKAPIMDESVGKAVVIRVFDFAMNPTMPKGTEIDRQGLFNAHSKQISTLLWADGLVPLVNVGPRVIIDVAKCTYKIFIPCEAKAGTVFAEKPRNLSEELLRSHKEQKH